MLNKLYVVLTSPIIVIAFIIDVLIGDIVTGVPKTITEKFTQMKTEVQKVWYNEESIF